MAKRRTKKAAGTIHLSTGPLPERLAVRFPGHGLVFTDASRLRHGGLAVIIYPCANAAPEIVTRSVALDGSNELEMQAAIFGLQQAALRLPGLPFALFSDNQDAVVRLSRVKAMGAAQDLALRERFPEINLDAGLKHATPCWVQGHGRCRGNALADGHARLAAGGEAPPGWPISP